MRPPRTAKDMARPLGVRGHQKRSNLVASYKMGREMFVESANEITTMLALDVDPRVLSITPQPFTVRLDIGQKFSTRAEAVRAEPRPLLGKLDQTAVEERIYTADFGVALSSPVPLVVESKSSVEIERIPAELARRERVLNTLGYRYLVVSSIEVGHLGLHSNLVHMRDTMKYRKQNDTRALLGALLDQIANRRDSFLLGEIEYSGPT